MALQIPAQLRDKKLLAVAGVGAVAGLVVLLRGGLGSRDIAAGSTTGGGTGVLPTFDSTGTDVASQLGQFGWQIQATLQDFIATQQDTLAALLAAQQAAAQVSGSTGGGTGVSRLPSAQGRPGGAILAPKSGRSWVGTRTGGSGLPSNAGRGRP